MSGRIRAVSAIKKLVDDAPVSEWDRWRKFREESRTIVARIIDAFGRHCGKSDGRCLDYLDFIKPPPSTSAPVLNEAVVFCRKLTLDCPAPIEQTMYHFYLEILVIKEEYPDYEIMVEGNCVYIEGIDW